MKCRSWPVSARYNEVIASESVRRVASRNQTHASAPISGRGRINNVAEAFKRLIAGMVYRRTRGKGSSKLGKKSGGGTPAQAS